MTTIVVARFAAPQQAVQTALVLTDISSDGAQFTAEHDSATGEHVVIRHESGITTTQEFAEALSAKFEDQGQFASKVFSVRTGNKYDKVFQHNVDGTSGSIHCFVEKATGGVYKAAGINAPAKGLRYASMDDALAAADLYGGYLYR